MLATPKMCNQTPRHSSTKYIKGQGTIKVTAEHWDYTTIIHQLLTIHGLKILVYLYFENSISKLVFENDVFAKF